MINDKIIKAIEKYQNTNHRRRCVHIPTCSEYSKCCYQKFNFFKASFLTFKRILLCTPLNKKIYDPVPLTKEEKEKDQNLSIKANSIKPYLLNHQDKYTFMRIDDYIKLIYQASFGPNHLNKNASIDDVLQYIKQELNDFPDTTSEVTDISDEYVRVYISKDVNLKNLASMFLKSNKEKNQDDYIVYYKRLDLLKELIKKKTINLPKSDIKVIDTYAKDTNLIVHHSNDYNEFYHPHYRIIRKDIYNKDHHSE